MVSASIIEWFTDNGIHPYVSTFRFDSLIIWINHSAAKRRWDWFQYRRSPVYPLRPLSHVLSWCNVKNVNIISDKFWFNHGLSVYTFFTHVFLIKPWIWHHQLILSYVANHMWVCANKVFGLLGIWWAIFTAGESANSIDCIVFTISYLIIQTCWRENVIVCPI